MLVIQAELATACAGTKMHPEQDDEAWSYERDRLPEWPPTGWYSNWALGKDLFGLAADERPPISLRWLTYRKAA